MIRYAVCAFTLVFTIACGSERRSDEPKPLSTQVSGLQVFIDPTTGEFIDPPPGATTPEAPSQGGARIAAAAEQPSPGGGTMLKLNGSFRSYMTASISPSGELHTECVVDGAAQ